MTETADTLSAKKRKLLELRLKEKRASLEIQTIPRRMGSDPDPMSFAQQRLWFLDQLEPGGAHYNNPLGLHLKGHLNVVVLQRCLDEIVRRHEPLRTRFETVEGRPVQVVEPITSLGMLLIDLSSLPEEQREAEALRLCTEETRRPFDLAHGPVLRAKLFRLGTEEHIFLLVVHHIALDGWSEGVLIRELMTLYQVFCEGKPSPLPELPIQYADYAVWQRERLRGEVLESQLNYWTKQLEGAPTLLELPADRPRPAIQSHRGARLSYELPQLLPALAELSRREGVSLFMTLLAAFQTLLHRYTGLEDIVIGSAFAGRNRVELESLIGMFVETLALRGDLAGNPTFRTLLQRTSEVCLEAFAHQDLPFEQLVAALQPKRDMSHSPLFQVMIELLNVPAETASFPELKVTKVELSTGASQFDLTFHVFPVSERGESLEVLVEYSTDLFDAASIERMVGHYRRLLEGIISDADQKISDLPLLTESERHQILVKWNQTEVDYPKDWCLHQLFEAQAERTPDAAAVVFEGSQLTYRELNERANQLAHHLQKLGVGPDVLVGLFMERSLEMVIGMYGILKAGGAYVPMDPEYPPERVAFMAKDAQVPVLLTQKHLMASLPRNEAEVVCLDSEWSIIAGENSENFASGTTAENLAYVIYTSGSTGMPKGAMNSHRGICNRLLWMQDAYQLTDEDHVLQKTPFSFDVSVWEFFWPLLVGARLIVARPGGHKDPGYLVNLIQEQEITTLHFVPPMLQVFLDEEGVEKCHSLKRVICSGEALPYELQERFFAKLPAELHNLYGPTEAAVDVSYWACKRDSDQGIVPIGYPVANTQLYILDSHLQAVPIGVTGELYIGGVQVGRGYLNRPELTAEKFVPDPFSRAAGARLYRTGDLARHLPGGEIEYLGRTDHQVKIRGLRIELGEIEALLEEHEAIQQAVVMAREDVPGDKRLVAYILPDGGQTPSAVLLRQYLQEKLPEYMVPSAFVMLEKFPLSPNGKIDRRALPKPKVDRQTEEGYVAPRNEVEKTIASIWRELLHAKNVGVNDNFFELGGHSLLLVKMLSRLQESFRKKIPIVEIFRHPTITTLASFLAQREKKEPSLQKAFDLAERQKESLKRQKRVPVGRRKK
jgi:amino acid adenylation domain-containing protein